MTEFKKWLRENEFNHGDRRGAMKVRKRLKEMNKNAKK